MWCARFAHGRVVGALLPNSEGGAGAASLGAHHGALPARCGGGGLRSLRVTMRGSRFSLRCVLRALLSSAQCWVCSGPCRYTLCTDSSHHSKRRGHGEKAFRQKR